MWTSLFTWVNVVSKDGGADEDIRRRINKARHAFNTLRPIWNSTALSKGNKIRIFNNNVKAVLLYGLETWRLTKTVTNKLQVFVNRCPRSILLAGKDCKCHTMGKNKTAANRQRNTQKEMGLNRTHNPQGSRKHRKAGPTMESARQEEGGEAQTDLP